MQDYKNNKLLELKLEFIKVEGQTDYIINGIDESRAIYFYREDKRKFKIIPPGSYTLVSVGGNRYLRITDTALLNASVEFQICYLFIKTSSSYIDAFPELGTLQDHYNQLYNDFTNILEQLKSNNILGDTVSMAYVLPQLNEGQVWVLRNSEMVAENIFDLDAKLQEVVEQFELVFSKWVDDTEKPRIDVYVAEKIKEAGKEIDVVTESEKVELDTYTEQKKGELDSYVSGRKPVQYGTVAELQATTNLKINDFVEVAGYYVIGDGSEHKRIISDKNNGTGVKLANGLWANETLGVGTKRIFMNFKSDLDTTIAVHEESDYNYFSKIIETDLNLRDPSFVFKNNMWYITGTSTILAENVEFTIYKTKDFVTFEAIKAKLGVITPEFNKVWAPELFVDSDDKIYVLTTIDIGEEVDAKGELISKHKPFFVEFFIDTETFGDVNYFKMPDSTNRIDCFMIRETERYLFFIKNEYNKNTQILYATSLFGTFTLINEIDLGEAIEGVCVVKENDATYRLYGDAHYKNYYITSTSVNLNDWSKYEIVSFNNQVRHGSCQDIRVGTLAYKNIESLRKNLLKKMQNFINLATFADSTGLIKELNLTNNCVYFVAGTDKIIVEKFTGDIERCYFVVRKSDIDFTDCYLQLNGLSGGVVTISSEFENNDIFNEVRCWEYANNRSYVFCGKREPNEVRRLEKNLSGIADAAGNIHNFKPEKGVVYYLNSDERITINSIVPFSERRKVEEVLFRFNTGSPNARLTIKGQCYAGAESQVSDKDSSIVKLVLDGQKLLAPSYGFVKVSQVFNRLNTPYHVEKMKLEGVYDDFVTYMDARTIYDNNMRNKANMVDSSNNDAPVPSQSLLKFKEKYLG